MRISLYTNSLDYGGASTFFLRLNSAFLENNVSSNIITFNNERNQKVENFLNKSLRKRIFYLRSNINENKSDAIITNYGLETLIAKIATINLDKNIKIISVVHVRSLMWIPKNMNSIKKFMFKSLLKLSFHVCDKCVAVSDDLKNELIIEKWIKESKITTIYNPVIKDDFFMKPRSIKNKDEINLAVIGWIWDIKNQEEAIKAIYKLNNKKFKLHIIGGIKDENYYKKLLEMVDKFNLKKQVFFDGVKNNIFSELENIDILLLTSKTEALPTVIIEALACGIPVVSKNCKVGPSEILCNGKYGYLYDDFCDLPKIIEELANNYDKYNNLSINSIKRSKDFTFYNAAKNYINVIKS